MQRVVIATLLTICAAGAATIARWSLDEMTGRSEMIVSGQITDSWGAWDSEHKYIWTHYRVAIDSTVKGGSARTLEIAEPGGTVGIVAMNVSGATGYSKGEHVLIFLERMPNGYLRTAGLGQGKYGIDERGRLHGIALKDVDVVNAGGSAAAPVHTLDGMTLAEATTHITTRMRATGAKGVR